jgi:AcrR family transcriptional regulator
LALLTCFSVPDGSAAERRAAERRAKVIAVARALFTEHGFHGTGIAQIAAGSGVKVGQLYRDFPNKEAIVAAIVEADLIAFLDEDALRTAIAAGDLAVVRRWIGRFVCSHAERSDDTLFPEICAEAARNERVAAIMIDVDRRVRGDLQAALAAFAPAAEQKGEVTVLTDLIITLKVGLASQVATQPGRDLSAVCERIESLIDDELERLRRRVPERLSA